jgi:hypothetical protein
MPRFSDASRIGMEHLLVEVEWWQPAERMPRADGGLAAGPVT